MDTLITDFFSGFETSIEGMGQGLKTAFQHLIYEDPAATTPVVSTLAEFLFVMAGVSLAIGIVYLIFHLIRGRSRLSRSS